MAYWVYKNNWSDQPYQRQYGDWRSFFASDDVSDWGSRDLIPELGRLRRGDTILCYQTNRNELVGTAVVTGRPPGKANGLPADPKRALVYLKPMERIGCQVRPLRKALKSIRAIPAFQPGPISTLYPISTRDAKALLLAARGQVEAADEAEAGAAEPSQGGGFGTPEQNRKVERAAMKAVVRALEDRRWRVRDCSKENAGYDLVATRGGQTRKIEVKGLSGRGRQIIITAKEWRVCHEDKQFELAMVQDALQGHPLITYYEAHKVRSQFIVEALSYRAKVPAG